MRSSSTRAALLAPSAAVAALVLFASPGVSPAAQLTAAPSGSASVAVHKKAAKKKAVHKKAVKKTTVRKQPVQTITIKPVASTGSTPVTTVTAPVTATPPSSTTSTTPGTPATTSAATTTTSTGTTTTTASTTSTHTVMTQSSGVIGDNTKTECVYTANSLSDLSQFESLVGTNINCALVYNDEAPAWANWEAPYFTGTNPDTEWGKWVQQVPGRTLIITQSMIPESSDNDSNWRAEGAAGDYDAYATQLAENLVAAGLGGSVIRLGHEANGTWYADNIGSDAADYAEWVQTWRNEAIAMESVPGAHFRFDWCVNAGYRNIPLADFYPGDDVVNIIGVDSYDAGVSGSGESRWNTIYNEADGLGAVAAFAKAHDKAMSIPEWGLDSTSDGGAGDDPGYVNGIGSVVEDNDVAYQSYFFNNDQATTLSSSPNSLAVYEALFAGGDSGNAPTP